MLASILLSVVYCSSSFAATGAETSARGSADNPYTDIRAALGAAKAHPGDTLLLKRGDTFYPRTQWFCPEGITIGAYGDGPLPVISNFGAVTDFSGRPFEPTDRPCVWRIDMTAPEVFSEGMTYVADAYSSEVGFIYHPASDSIMFGHKVNCATRADLLRVFPGLDLQAPLPEGHKYTYLERDGDFMQSADGHIYVYSTRDPNSLGTLKFAFSGCGLFNVRTACVTSLRIEGFATHAIGGGCHDCLIRGLEIDLIGGAVQPLTGDTSRPPRPSDSPDFTRYGNGIELWIAPHAYVTANVTVDSCRITRVYDTATTLQGYVGSDWADANPGSPCARDITFSHNRISRCRQAFECFAYLRDSATLQTISTIYPVANCRFVNNVASLAGENGFNSPSRLDCQIYSGTTGMQLAYNTFYDGSYLCRYGVQTFDFGPGNRCHIRPGQMFIRSSSGSVMCPVEADAVAQTIRLYRDLSGDRHTEFIVIY